jgi:hypothetical protein
LTDHVTVDIGVGGVLRKATLAKAQKAMPLGVEFKHSRHGFRRPQDGLWRHGRLLVVAGSMMMSWPG